MKKHLLTSLSIFAAMGLSYTTTAQCTWQPVGTGTVSGGTSTAMSSDLAISNSNTPYLVYSDGGAANAATVKSFTAGAWTAVGTGSVHANTAYNSIAISPATGQPYVAFQDKSAALLKGTVMMYNGSAWTAVGTGTVSTDTASYLSMAVDNSGTPYVAFADRASGKKAVVKKYSGGVWTAVGAAVSTGTAAYTYLALDAAGTPYLAYQDVMNGGRATVKAFNGSAWVAVGTGTVSTNSAAWVSLKLDGAGVPYVAYIDGSGYIASVKNFSAGAWQTVGSSTVAVNNAYTALDLALDPAGMPYISYYDLGSYKTSVMKYNAGAWSYAGNSGISASPPSITSIAIDHTGIPYVGDCESPAVVRKLSGNGAVVTQPASLHVCEGLAMALTIVATGTTGITYQWQVNPGTAYGNLAAGAGYTGVTSANLGINPAVPGMNGNTYRCVMNDGCTNLVSNSATLTVNPKPTVAVNSATICQGTVKTLTASGATTYSWTSGATTATIAASPTVAATYTVFGTDVNGCKDTAVSNIAVISSKTLSGTVSSTAGAVSGNVILYRYSPVLGQWDSTAFTPFSSIFSFGTVDSALYVVKAVPTATNVQITYGTSAISWQNATVIAHGCALNSTQHIDVIPYTLVTTGSGFLGGKITEAHGYGHKTANVEAPGNPIPGVVVKGGKNPGSAIFGQTVTDTSGNYSFGSLPLGDYFILVDIPGLDTNLTYHKTLSPTNDSYTTLDFTVDSIYVNPVDVTTSVNELNKADYLVKLFPNPARNYFTLQYSLLKQADVKLELFDVVGKRVQTLQPSSRQEPGNHAPSFNTGALSPGIYFVKLLVNQDEATIKVFITD